MTENLPFISVIMPVRDERGQSRNARFLSFSGLSKERTEIIIGMNVCGWDESRNDNFALSHPQVNLQ
jgi:hypothetical protein